MKKITTQKNAFWSAFLVIFFYPVIIGMVTQGCIKEEESMEMSASKINTVQKTEEFAEFTAAFYQYKEEMFAAISSMTDEERNLFLENKYDDEQMRLFLEKYDLLSLNLRLQKGAYNFVHRTNFDDLDSQEKEELFNNHVFPDNGVKNSIPRLKSVGEIGIESCYAEFNRKLTNLTTIVHLKFLGCTCMLEIPVAACICYATILAEFYIDRADIQAEYERCLKNK